VSTVDLLLAIAVSVSMLVGWWRGRRSVGLGAVGRIFDEPGTTCTGRFVVGRVQTRFVVLRVKGDAWFEESFTLNDELFAEAIRAWIEVRGAP
jgi:hypothetical protein